MFTQGYIALILEYAGPPNLDTDPLKCPHYVGGGGGDRNGGNTKQMPHVRKKKWFSFH